MAEYQIVTLDAQNNFFAFIYILYDILYKQLSANSFHILLCYSADSCKHYINSCHPLMHYAIEDKKVNSFVPHRDNLCRHKIFRQTESNLEVVTEHSLLPRRKSLHQDIWTESETRNWFEPSKWRKIPSDLIWERSW